MPDLPISGLSPIPAIADGDLDAVVDISEVVITDRTKYATALQRAQYTADTTITGLTTTAQTMSGAINELQSEISTEDLWDLAVNNIKSKVDGRGILTVGGGLGNNDNFTNYQLNLVELTGILALDQQQTATSGFISINASEWQSFTAGVTDFLIGVGIRYKSGGSGSSTGVTISIREGEGIAGAIIAEETGVTIPRDSAITFIPLTSYAYLKAGQQYTIHITNGSDPAWEFMNGNPYAGGIFGLNPSDDGVFETYMQSGFGFNVRKDLGLTQVIGDLDIQGQSTLEVDLATGADVATDVEVTLTAEVDDVTGNRVIMNGYSGGLTGGEDVFGYFADLRGNANDTNGRYSAFAASFSPNGGTNKGWAFVNGTDFDKFILALSGDIEFRDYDVTIHPVRLLAGVGNDVTISGGDGLSSVSLEPRAGGNLLLSGGAGVNGGADGGVKIDSTTFALASGTTVNEILDSGTLISSSSTDDQLFTAKNGYDYINSYVSGLGAISAIADGDLFHIVDAGVNKSTTALKVAQYVTASSSMVSALGGKEDTIAAGTTGQYWRGDKSWQTLDKSAVGLANVDNTSDLSKPISTATQTALDAKRNNALVTAPTAFDDPGSVGQEAYAAGYLYKCVATDTWVRWAVVTSW